LAGLAVAVLSGIPGVFAASVARAASALPAAKVTSLTGVSCHSRAICYAVGNGAVLVTRDGGRVWKRLPTPAGADSLAAIACPSAMRCEVVGSGGGDAGAIYGTTDGGATWHTQPAVIGGGFFLAIACPSITVCEATGNEGAIFGTVDGGSSWSQQSVPSSANLIEGIACLSTRTCEAVGYGGQSGGTGLALRTVDGGRTWTGQRLPLMVQLLNGISCSSQSDCVAVGMSVIDAGSKEIGIVATTTNGGLRWTRRQLPSGFVDLTSVACPNQHVCEAAGLGDTPVLGSTDGGTSWESQRIPGSVYLEGIACPTSKVCEAVGENANGDAALYRTTNRGTTWTHQHVGDV